MKIQAVKHLFYYSFILSLVSISLRAQDRNLTITQDPKFEQLLNEKRKTNASIAVDERYKIQVFSGDSDTAKKILTDCKLDFTDLDGTIVFNTPNYKVWLGNFRTKIEAERHLIEIRTKYENAYLIKPQK
ncbi:hypothetical protein [Flavobacterium sp. ACAM 123]|jgi:hypothetical protein|uniref:hypothetical protein n=1 Tax=Flavobacterium sp. ACAM 123 TaxID=1189620 RepID=UPI0002EADB11|nr:hypothetical protein [Flavobacterium sp. ACAM 123]